MASCASNEKQLALAIIMYTSDYDETYPGYYGWAPNNQNGCPATGSWGNRISPYLKSTAVFACPDIPKGLRWSYNMNSMLGAGNDANVPPDSMRGQMTPGNNQAGGSGVIQALVHQPTTTIMVFEGGSSYDQGNCGSTLWGSMMMCATFNSAACYGNGYIFPTIHNNQSGMNMALCDGHVKYFNAATLYGINSFAGAPTLAGYNNAGTFVGAAAPNNGIVDFQIL